MEFASSSKACVLRLLRRDSASTSSRASHSALNSSKAASNRRAAATDSPKIAVCVLRVEEPRNPRRALQADAENGNRRQREEPVGRFFGCAHHLPWRFITWHGGDPSQVDLKCAPKPKASGGASGAADAEGWSRFARVTSSRGCFAEAVGEV